MTTFRIDTPRGPVAGIETGEGPVLVLVAGLGSSNRIWGDLPSVLGRHFTVIAIDNRGIGGSRSGHPFSLTDAALDVVATVDGRGHHRFALLGASMGGVIALATAIEAPRRVGCLVLASCAARLTRHGQRSLELLRDLLRHLPPERVGPALMTIAFAPPFSRRFPGLVDETARLYGLDPADQPGATDQVERLLVGWACGRSWPSSRSPRSSCAESTTRSWHPRTLPSSRGRCRPPSWFPSPARPTPCSPRAVARPSRGCWASCAITPAEPDPAGVERVGAAGPVPSSASWSAASPMRS